MHQVLRQSGVAIRAVVGHLPKGRLDNVELSRRFPEWSAEDILRKTGIASRVVAEPGECASDLAAGAALKLFAEHDVDPATLDLLVFCSQSPDHFLPTTACLLQDRLGLPTSAMAFDLPLGCSGYVYALAVIRGLLTSGQVQRALLLTGDTYSRLIDPEDKSVATIFGDAGSATLIEVDGRDGGAGFGPFVFGTDGSGGKDLIVEGGAARHPDLEPRLYMDGPKIFEFCLRRIPALVDQVLSAAELGRDEVDLYVFHQANRYMLERLRKRLDIQADRFAYRLEDIGNTVSSTIPLTLEQLVANGRLVAGMRICMVGFGVGSSWGAGIVEWH